MKEIPVEEEHTDILQNIEFAIHQIYVKKPDLTDYQVDSALEALSKTYLGEATARPPVLPRSPLSIEVYHAMHAACEVRLGRAPKPDILKKVGKGKVRPVSVDVILRCLKRLRKSVSLWTKEGGRQGYLNYISQFMV